jgi:hypothetical protein
VPHLQDHLVVFTDREAPSGFYGSFVAGKVRLDIRRLPASMVVGAALPLERQDQQNVRKLKGLNYQHWKQLVDLIYQERLNADLQEVSRLMGLDRDSGGMSSVEANAARSNMHTIIQMLHDPNSRLLDQLEQALRDGKLCVVDLSRMSGETARIMAGILLDYLFTRNQDEFIKRDARTIPIIAVLEEAQSVLGRGEETAYAPFVRWVKEGRKYDLGAVMITQQPGSIPQELLSQGDVWFVFHLLSEGDLKAVQRANAHFSEDLLSALLNEPIPGHCVFWSSAGGKPYPLPMRILSFEARYALQDANYNRSSAPTYASQLHARYLQAAVDEFAPEESDTSQDYLDDLQQRVIQRLRNDPDLHRRMRNEPYITWVYLKDRLYAHVIAENAGIANPERLAFDLIGVALRQIFGEEGIAWQSYREGGRRVVEFSEDAKQRFLNQNGQQA